MYVSKCKKLDLCDDKRFIIRALYEHNPLVIQYLADHDVDKYGVAAKLRNIAARYKKLSDVESEDFKQWLGQIQEKKICVWNFQKWGEVIPRITTV